MLKCETVYNRRKSCSDVQSKSALHI